MVEPVDTGSILRTLLEEQADEMCTGGPPPPTKTPTRDVLRYHNAFHIDAKRRQQCAASAVNIGALGGLQLAQILARLSKAVCEAEGGDHVLSLCLLDCKCFKLRWCWGGPASLKEGLPQPRRAGVQPSGRGSAQRQQCCWLWLPECALPP